MRFSIYILNRRHGISLIVHAEPHARLSGLGPNYQGSNGIVDFISPGTAC